MGAFDFIVSIYDKNYKPLMLVPIVLFVLSLIVLGVFYAQTGEFVNKGVSLKGGMTLTVPVLQELSIEEMQRSLSQTLPGDINVRGLSERGRTTFIIIEATDVPEEQLRQAVEQQGFDLTDANTETMGPSLGRDFFRQTMYAILAAFIAMSIVVFITFRKIVPSLLVMLAASTTLIMTLAAVNALGVRLSTAGIAAFLMLIGYSVDTDILLTTRVLKRRESTLFERVKGATRTGLTMTFTSFVATLVAFFFTQSDVIKQIMLILTIGLLFDMINTWLQNASILRWHLERKERGKDHD